MDELKKILKKQLEWYKNTKQKEEIWEVDSSYIYDTTCEVFEDLSRWDFVEILEILSK